MVTRLAFRPRRRALHQLAPVSICCGLVILSLCNPAVCAEPEDRTLNGYHSGFYARFITLGPGWLQLVTKEGQNTSGGALGVVAVFGHDFGLVRGLVFGIGLSGLAAEVGTTTPSYTLVDSSANGERRVRPSSLNLAIFGAFCQYYLVRASGWHVGGVAGYARTWLWNKEFEDFAWSVSAGGHLWLGYDARIASELAVGISLGAHSAIPRKLVGAQGRTVSSIAAPVGFGLYLSLVWY